MFTYKIQHPKSLRTFVTTEMWERYGFYVVQTLLALYLVMHLGWPDIRVYKLVGSFTALTYISPVIGGWIADHLIGQKRAVLLGTGFLFVSYITISFVTSDIGLCTTLSGIAVGNGLLKPNISSLLGNEYHRNAPNRESGFTIFYIGITIGIVLGTTIPSIITEKFGWSSSFLSAAVGMIFSAITFLHGVYFYKIKDYYQRSIELDKIIYALALIFILWLISYNILTYPSLADTLFLIVTILCVTYFINCVKNETKLQSKRTIVIGLLCLISILFWTFYFQMFLSLTLFIVRVVKANLLGIKFPPPYYVGIQSVGMIFLGMILSRNYKKLSKSQNAERSGNKFLFSIICMTIAYGLIVLICYLSSSSELIHPLLLIPVYLIISLAELLLSPVGLSSVTLLASNKKVSTMLGIFFVSLGLGGFLSGKLAALTAMPAGNSSIYEFKMHYLHSFGKLFIILFISMFVCFLINFQIKRLMSNKRNIN